MEQPDRIHLRDHVIQAEIGAFQSERGRTQRLRFNLTVDLRDAVDGVDDHVDRIMSYDVLTQAVDTALADQRYNLVESLAEKIAAEVLADPRAARITVTVEKLDRGPGALGITISRNAGRVGAVAARLPVRIILGAPPEVPSGAMVLIPIAPDLPLPLGGDQRRIKLLALDQASWAMAGHLSLEVVESRTEIDAAIRNGQAVIWAPTRLAVDSADAGDNPATLAQWLASRLGAPLIEMVLPKAAPLPESVGIPVARFSD